MSLLETLSQPWHWAVSGIMISINMFLLIYFGKKLGISTSYQALCAMTPGAKRWSYFNYNWRDHAWLLFFVCGLVIGGYIGINYLGSPEPVKVSAATVSDLAAIGINVPQNISEGNGYVPTELFNFQALTSFKGILLLLVGGFFVGFGTRWAGGCTSGHAITGISGLQLPSLVAVIGFFIGGLTMTHLLFPLIF